MKFFENLSIKNKITFLIVSFTTAALLFGFTLVIIFDILTFRGEMISQTMLIAKVVGDYNVSSLAFGYNEEADNALQQLESIPDITFAAMYNIKGELFARYSRYEDDARAPAVKKESSEFRGGALHIYRSIKFKDEIYGTIYIRASNTQLIKKILNHLIILSLIALGLGIIAFTFAVKFQGVISNPILNLAETASRITEGKDYSIRVERSGDDEIGVLSDAFNNMLAQVEAGIEERNRAEFAVKRSESRFRNMILESNDPVFVLCRGRFAFVNPVFEKYFEYSLSEIIDDRLKLLDIVTDDSRDHITDLLLKRSHGKDVVLQHDIRGVSKRGNVYDFSLNFSIITWDDEKALLGTLRDITERKRALKELKGKQEELYHMRLYLQNIIDSMPSILIGIDYDGRITQWNQEAELAAGIKKTEAEGKYVGEVFPLYERLREKVEIAIRKREIQKEERLANRTNGEIRYSDVMVYPLVANGVEGAVIRIDDITSRVQIENMMVQTEKMMSVGGLAAGMAHEINNPLGGMLMSAQNLIRRISPDLPKNVEVALECGISLDNLQKYMEKRGLLKMLTGIQEMGERAAKIVANMLSFSRRSESKKMAVDLKDIMDTTLELAANDYDLKKKYDFKHIKIVKEYEEDLPRVFCAVTEIEQVLLNLLKNASQAMREKGRETESPRIDLRIKGRGDHVTIEVEDNGPGMSADECKRAFEPFFTTKQVGVGTGLGLSVSYFIIANNHNGEMSVESSPGSGAKFIIKLPVGGK